jgi:hypothetical protein
LNPHLTIFFKRIALVALIAGGLYGVYSVLSHYTSIDFAAIGAYIMYGFFAVTVAGMFVLILGVTFKDVWTAILGRSETIFYCCVDKSGEGLHVVSKHYFHGGESTDGYDAFYHYYIRISDGRIYLSKKIRNEKSIAESTTDLRDKHKLTLNPDLSNKVDVGHYTDEGEKTIQRTFSAGGGTINITSFNSLLDYGFRISYLNESKKERWRRTI